MLLARGLRHRRWRVLAPLAASNLLLTAALRAVAARSEGCGDPCASQPNRTRRWRMPPSNRLLRSGFQPCLFHLRRVDFRLGSWGGAVDRSPRRLDGLAWGEKLSGMAGCRGNLRRHCLPGGATAWVSAPFTPARMLFLLPFYLLLLVRGKEREPRLGLGCLQRCLACRNELTVELLPES